MKDVSVQIDLGGGAQILQVMAMKTVEQSANAIAARANSMAASVSSEPIEFEVTSNVGVIKNGARAIATVHANTTGAHQGYVARTVLAKSKDGGRVK